MTKEIEKVYELADELYGTVRSDYSGRGMYGEVCYGVVADVEYDEAIAQATRLDLPRPRIDSMGQNLIIYFPTIEGEYED